MRSQSTQSGSGSPPPDTTPLRHLTILSPHRDDAAFSCGLLLTLAAQRAIPCTVLNFFTVSSYAPYAPPSPTGELTTSLVSALRREEDLALARTLTPHIHLHDLALTDAPVRLGLPVHLVLADPLPPPVFARESASLAEVLRAELAPLPPGPVLAPLALGDHIDHRLVREAARLAVDPQLLGFYQDLPYACRLPANTTIDPPPGTRPFLLHSPDAPARKRHLASLYPSQIAPEVASEIASYTAAIGGEQLYLPAALAPSLDPLLSGTLR